MYNACGQSPKPIGTGPQPQVQTSHLHGARGRFPQARELGLCRLELSAALPLLISSEQWSFISATEGFPARAFLQLPETSERSVEKTDIASVPINQKSHFPTSFSELGMAPKRAGTPPRGHMSPGG